MPYAWERDKTKTAVCKNYEKQRLDSTWLIIHISDSSLELNTIFLKDVSQKFTKTHQAS